MQEQALQFTKEQEAVLGLPPGYITYEKIFENLETVIHINRSRVGAEKRKPEKNGMKKGKLQGSFGYSITRSYVHKM